MELQRVVLLGGIEGDPLFQVGAGWDQLAQSIQGDPQDLVGPYEARWLWLVLGQREALFRELPCRLELPPVKIKHPESRQNDEEPRGVPHLLTQLPGAGESVPCLRGRKALSVPQRLSQHELHLQLMPGARGG